MKHISHEFVNQFDAILPSMIYIGMHDKCRHCGKSVGFMAGQTYSFKFKDVIHPFRRKEFEFEANNVAPCLTEDEFIIKNIIE